MRRRSIFCFRLGSAAQRNAPSVPRRIAKTARPATTNAEPSSHWWHERRFTGRGWTIVGFRHHEAGPSRSRIRRTSSVRRRPRARRWIRRSSPTGGLRSSSWKVLAKIFKRVLFEKDRRHLARRPRSVCSRESRNRSFGNFGGSHEAGLFGRRRGQDGGRLWRDASSRGFSRGSMFMCGTSSWARVNRMLRNG
jgi:hypothetical protein